MYTLMRTNVWVLRVQMNLACLRLYKYLSDELLTDGYLLYGFHSSFASLSYSCFIFWCQNHFSLKAERWNQSKESPKWSSLSYWIFWSNGLAERNCKCWWKQSVTSLSLFIKRVARIKYPYVIQEDSWCYRKCEIQSCVPHKLKLHTAATLIFLKPPLWERFPVTDDKYYKALVMALLPPTLHAPPLPAVYLRIQGSARLYSQVRAWI